MENEKQKVTPTEEQQLPLLGMENNEEKEKLRAVYALNMCTVSVSQIVKYKDTYILDQEYDAILNNLNLEAMPKDEALLNILTELLNTITAFKIQEIKKKQIEKDYQKRVKAAIWSAVPNFSVIVAGNPFAIATSLVTQIGSGYMNYRKEKANALFDKEKEEVELYIVALEQFNALRRELFTTAWRLADRYGYRDNLRLTERQIDQYNEILMDPDEYRKYARLEAIQDKFKAYPPFWYFFAHTAMYIAAHEQDEGVQKRYLELAKGHFADYKTLNQFNVLREDQLTSSANLEYADLLMTGSGWDREEVHALIEEAQEKAGNANDILQLCAVSYLRNGDFNDAAKVLKILVNEEYNAATNAKILSQIYVKTITGTASEEEKAKARAEYIILSKRVNPVILFPLEAQDGLENKFLSNQRELLMQAFRLSMDAYRRKCAIRFNEVIPTPISVTADYYDRTSNAENRRIELAEQAFASERKKERFLEQLRESDFSYGFVDALNKTVAGLESLSLFRSFEKHDDIIKNIEVEMRKKKAALKKYEGKLQQPSSFSIGTYKEFLSQFSFDEFTKEFFKYVKKYGESSIKNAGTQEDLEQIENDLSAFCEAEGLPEIESYAQIKGLVSASIDYTRETFFNFDLLGGTAEKEDVEQKRNSIIDRIKDSLSAALTENAENTRVLFYGDSAFDAYFKNSKLNCSNRYLQKQRTAAIIDDTRKRDTDLLLGVDGISVIRRNQLRDTYSFEDAEYENEKGPMLKIGGSLTYENAEINIETLKGILDDLSRLG